MSDPCSAGDRFDRIEEWLARLAESSQQIITLITETRHNRKDLDDHEGRLRSLEKSSVTHSFATRWIERIVWIFVVGFLWFVQQGFTNG